MSLAPLLAAPWQIQVHAFAAMAAFALGATQLALPKGTIRHRSAGWVWVGLMAIIAVTSFFIHTICNLGGFSWIHALSILTLVSLPVAVAHARHHRVRQHQRLMLILFFAALVIAGLFTFVPGRIMHDVAFGSQSPHGACA